MRPASLLIAATLLLSCAAAAAPAGAPAQSNATRAAAAPIVVMYATQTCGYCRKARQYFEQRGIAWREVDIESSEAARQEFKSRGGVGTPLIFVDDVRVAGYDPARLDALLASR